MTRTSAYALRSLNRRRVPTPIGEPSKLIYRVVEGGAILDAFHSLTLLRAANPALWAPVLAAFNAGPSAAR